MADAILSVELTAKIDGFRDAFNKAIRETDNLNRNTKSKVAEIDKAFADLATQVERSMAKSVGSTTSASNSISKNLAKVAASSQNVGGAVAKGSNQAAFALTNLGRVAQDAPFGFIGIQNNLNPLLESFQRLKSETGSNASAFKSLASSMIGPAGLGFALSIVGSAILFYQQYQQKANKATVDAKKNTDDYVNSLNQLDQVQLKGAQNAQKELTSLQTLYSVATNTTISLNQRKKAVDELQKEYPKYFANLKDETVLNGGAKAAYDSLTQSIIATARARAAQDLITKNSSRKLENEQKIIDLEKEQLKNQLALSKAEKQRTKDNPQLTTVGVSTNTKAEYEYAKAQAVVNQNLKQRRDLVTDSNLLDEKSLQLTKSITEEVKKGADLTGDNNKKLTVSPKLAKGNELAKLFEKDVSELLGLNKVTVIEPIFELKPQIIGLSTLQKLINETQLEINRLTDTPNLLNTAAMAIGNSFEAMGEAIASGGNILQAAGAVIQKSFADLLSALGTQFITIGSAKVAAGILAGPLGGKMIGEGIGLIALGSSLKLGGGVVSGIGKGKKQTGSSSNITAFAQGGVIYGPTLGLMGEYAGAKSDPEVVAPLSKLKGLLGLEDTKQSAAMNAMSTIMGNTSSRAGNVTNMNIIKNMMGQTDSAGNVIQRTDREVVVLQSETVLRGSDILIITKKAQSVANRIK